MSTFNATEKSTIPVPDEYSAAVFGFERQASLVSVGIEAVINRALKEGHDIIIEGVHVVPGFVADEIIRRERTFGFLLSIEDAETHRNRFTLRSLQSDLRRPAEHYLNYFAEIREIHEYLKTRAEKYGFIVIENENSDYTVEVMLEGIFTSIQRSHEEQNR